MFIYKAFLTFKVNINELKAEGCDMFVHFFVFFQKIVFNYETFMSALCEINVSKY